MSPNIVTFSPTVVLNLYFTVPSAPLHVPLRLFQKRKSTNKKFITVIINKYRRGSARLRPEDRVQHPQQHVRGEAGRRLPHALQPGEETAIVM